MTSRVCFDLTPLSTGSRYRGIGTYALALARAFTRVEVPRGIDLHLLIGRGLAMRVVPLDGDVPAPDVAGGDGAAIPYGVYYGLKHTVVLTRLLLHRADLYHATDPKGTPEPPGCRTVVTCHDLIPTVLGPPYRPAWVPERASAALDRVRYRAPDHVVAISDWTRRDVQRVTGLPDDRVTVIHHGVDSEVCHPREARGEREAVARVTGPGPYLLYVGGFDARKQVPELVRAFGRVKAAVRERLVICGRMRPAQRAAIEAAMDETGARDRVVLAGFVPFELLPALYRGATAHVMPSTYEGFGMTLVEAFACGCPVVAADASCVPEIAGGAALLVPPRDLDALGAAMVRVSTEPELRADLVVRGLDRAAHFTWERCARETLAVYTRVLG